MFASNIQLGERLGGKAPYGYLRVEKQLTAKKKELEKSKRRISELDICSNVFIKTM